MVQWWHGRPVPMAGVASVTVAPEARGQGVGGALMSTLVRQIAARGYPLSVLYPATATVYRAVGYEIAGGQYQASIPARSLRSLLPPDIPAGQPPPGGPAGQPPPGASAGQPPPGGPAGQPPPPGGPGGQRPPSPWPAGPGIRRAGPGAAAEISAVLGRVHEAARACGPSDFDLGVSARLLDDPGVFCYLADDGVLIYGWHDGNNEIMVYCLLAGSARTARALWSVIASYDSMASTVRAYCSPDDPVSWLTREPDVSLTRRHSWMLRVVDAAAAIAGRGFPASAQADVTLQLADSLLPANAGRWRLSVSDGKGALSGAETDAPAGLPPAAPLILGARGFAALYAGTPLATLRLAGLAAGGAPAADAALDIAFAGHPFMLDYF